MVKLLDILQTVLEEEKKKRDRCLRIADRKYGKPSAYKSGAVVRCRKGGIWKDLKEGKQVGTLYHYTSAEGLKNILKTGQLKTSEENYLGHELHYISFTRNKNFHKKGSKFGVQTEYRIALDGDKLSNKYKIRPFSYIPGWDIKDSWELDWLDDEPESVRRDFFNATGDYDEQEERIFFKNQNSGIGNIKNYILAVDKVEALQEDTTPSAEQRIDELPKGDIWKDLKEDNINENWQDTSWENEKGQKITLPQLLDIIKNYPTIQAPIEKIKKIVIKKDSGGIESDRLSVADFKYPIIIIVDDNGDYKYIIDGNHRANKAIDAKLKSIPAKLVNVKKLPQEFQDILSEVKKETLHTWFARKGPKGKEGGWIDCNAPDGKGGYKACGRKKGEKRSKYPACKETPAQCKAPGKGKTWGKTK